MDTARLTPEAVRSIENLFTTPEWQVRCWGGIPPDSNHRCLWTGKGDYTKSVGVCVFSVPLLT